MGRPRVEDHPEFEKVRATKRDREVKLQKLAASYERQKQVIETDWQNDYAKSIVAAMEGGLSRYGVGRATGVTGSEAQIELIEWAAEKVRQGERARRLAESEEF